MSARLAAFLAAVLVRLLHRRRRPAVARLTTARRQANWDNIDLTLADLRRAA
jgi:hypothetical protein